MTTTEMDRAIDDALSELGRQEAESQPIVEPASAQYPTAA